MRKLIRFDEWTNKIEEKDCGCGEKVTEKQKPEIDTIDNSLDSIAGLKKSIKERGVSKTIDMIEANESEEQITEKRISPDTRKEMVDKGYALPDGSFPIENVADLKKAIKAYGRAKDQSAAAKHIAKRAKALGKSDLIPHTEDFQKSLKG
jgi:hypothetical protein